MKESWGSPRARSAQPGSVHGGRIVPVALGGVDVLSSRILLRPAGLDRSRRLHRDVLGLAIYWEFGPAEDPGVAFLPGRGSLEVSGWGSALPGVLW